MPRASAQRAGSIDYEEVMKAKTALTRSDFQNTTSRSLASAGFRNFLTENRDWVVPYAVFCVKRDEFGTADFSRWGSGRFRPRKPTPWPRPASAVAGVSYHIWLQYELDRQLADAVAHLHQHGIALKGDLPIGIDRQSVDAWSAPHLFKMDAQAGAPPDAFAVKGQNWGFPPTTGRSCAADGYAWWRSRFAKLSRYFDAYRIDHILGFFRIWQIPCDQVEGIMGWFDPAMPVHIDEIRAAAFHSTTTATAAPTSASTSWRTLRRFPEARLRSISMIAATAIINSANVATNGGSSITSPHGNVADPRLRARWSGCAARCSIAPARCCFSKSPDRKAPCSIRAARCT
jgi:hypothetical protein